MNQKEIFSKVDKTKECWEWKGTKGSHGYGRLFFDGKEYLAHRFFYEFHRGKIPPDKQIDHLCRVRHCVNPIHMELVSVKENVLRGIGITAKNKTKTHCIHGHEFTEQNTIYRKDGARECRECRSKYAIKYYNSDPQKYRDRSNSWRKKNKDLVNARKRKRWNENKV